MACALTSDYSLSGCKDGIGGLANVYFIEHANASGLTKASGVITALTKASGIKFRKYELQRATASYTETVEASPENGTVAYKQELKIILNRNTVALRNELLLVLQNRLLAVVEFKDGTFWLMGEEGGVDGSGGTRTSGTAGVDRNGYELTFTAEESEFAPEVASAVSSVLQTAG